MDGCSFSDGVTCLVCAVGRTAEVCTTFTSLFWVDSSAASPLSELQSDGGHCHVAHTHAHRADGRVQTEGGPRPRHEARAKGAIDRIHIGLVPYKTGGK